MTTPTGAVWARYVIDVESGDGFDKLGPKLLKATQECMAILEREGATGEWFRSPRVDPLYHEFDTLQYVVSMARMKP